ncbi:RNA polymerase sigma factor SigZ [Pontibacter vulgaris]|uniref:RNA polymerase sigma factor SigZ n=1 Tax=Pontibacter vulgaris TaxID=2905679 RepID=UPI001FA70FD5|nr:RNA polymerase sigma factor SigZ [Pontibacter vulgaris]
MAADEIIKSPDGNAACACVAPVFLEYEAQLKGFVLKRVKDKDEANDILQQLYLKLYKNCEQLQQVQNMSAWLYQITRNAVNDYFRSQGRSISIEEESELADLKQEPNQQDVEMLVLPLLQLLPPSYAEPLRLSEIEGISQKEVAERLGISYSGAKSRVQRGRQLLKQKFMECCHLEMGRNGELLSAHVRSDCTPLQGKV